MNIQPKWRSKMDLERTIFNRNWGIYFFSLILMCAFVQAAYTQSLQIPKKDRITADSLLRAASLHSDSAWVVAYPKVLDEIAQGRPYVPWAGFPDDLVQSDIPAFPGAEGGGAYTPGGRSGKVFVVTTLADNGPGSFREACETGGARIVVFNVAGIIHLKSPIILRAPYITIAGQTAPGDGVCVAGESIWIETHDVVIRHMRFRRGETNVGRRDNPLGGKPIGNIIFDHVSVSWGLDENLTIYDYVFNDCITHKDEELYAVNITIQNSIVSEALDTWNHACGGTLGGRNCTYMRNLWACNTRRNPTVTWCGTFNFVNNVLFNWVTQSVGGGTYRIRYNIINNYYKPGPSTPVDDPVGYCILQPNAGQSNCSYTQFRRCYVNGNIVEGNTAVSENNWSGGVQVDGADTDACLSNLRTDKPFAMPYFPILNAGDAFGYVLENSGALLPVRDAVDERVVKMVRTGEPIFNTNYVMDTTLLFKGRLLPVDSYKKGIITDIRQVGGYPEYKGKPYKDSDKDGMPDEWELKYKLNPNDPSDAMKDCNGDGYTNIEKYINNIDPTKKVDWKDLKNNHDTLAEKYK